MYIYCVCVCVCVCMCVIARVLTDAAHLLMQHRAKACHSTN